MVFQETSKTLGRHCIETASGSVVDVTNPQPESINIHDIAWALSRMARFAGHTISSEIWSIGQHSVFTANIIRAATVNSSVRSSLDEFLRHAGVETPDLEKAQLYALLHDASEAYLVDIPSPLKRVEGIRETYLKLEAQMMEAIYHALDVPKADNATATVVTWADLLALRIEAANLSASRGVDWGITRPAMTCEEMWLMPRIKGWNETFREFLELYNKLKR